jgi:hypothetical protein
VDPFNVFGLPDLVSTDVERLRAHSTDVAHRHGLRWCEEEIVFLDAEGDIGDRWFVSPTITNEFDYLVALHEAGHHVLRLPTFHADGATVNFENEVAVWKWVLEHALVDVSEAAWDSCRLCLRSYPEQQPPQECVGEMRDLSPEPGALMRRR